MALLKKCYVFLAVFCVLNQSYCDVIDPQRQDALWVQDFAARYSGGVFHSPIESYGWQWIPDAGHYFQYYVRFRASFPILPYIRICEARVTWPASPVKSKYVQLGTKSCM